MAAAFKQEKVTMGEIAWWFCEVLGDKAGTDGKNSLPRGGVLHHWPYSLVGMDVGWRVEAETVDDCVLAVRF